MEITDKKTKRKTKQNPIERIQPIDCWDVENGSLGKAVW